MKPRPPHPHLRRRTVLHAYGWPQTPEELFLLSVMNQLATIILMISYVTSCLQSRRRTYFLCILRFAANNSPDGLRRSPGLVRHYFRGNIDGRTYFTGELDIWRSRAWLASTRQDKTISETCGYHFRTRLIREAITSEVKEFVWSAIITGRLKCSISDGVNPPSTWACCATHDPEKVKKNNQNTVQIVLPTNEY